MSIAYYNGKFSNLDDVKISLCDRAIYFGDGVYDAAIGIGNRIYMEDEHIDRFLGNAEKLGIILPLDEDKLRDLLRKCVKLSGENCFFLYFQATRKSNERKHACCQGLTSNILITVTELPYPDPKRTLSLSFYEDKRYSYCNIKTLNLLPSVLASTDAESKGFDEAIFIRKGVVTECAHSNIAIIKGGELFTHPNGCNILPGTARKRMIDTALDMGVICHDVPFTKETLLSADEILVTSSTKLCIRAKRVEGYTFNTESGTIGDKICMSMFDDFLKSMK